MDTHTVDKIPDKKIRNILGKKTFGKSNWYQKVLNLSKLQKTILKKNMKLGNKFKIIVFFYLISLNFIYADEKIKLHL